MAVDQILEDFSVALRDNIGGDRVATFSAPITTAVGLAELDAVRVCWNICRVKLLERNKQLYYRCGESGHFTSQCTAEEVVRKYYAWQCPGHVAQECASNTTKDSEHKLDAGTMPIPLGETEIKITSSLASNGLFVLET